jgi:hypothetical protein
MATMSATPLRQIASIRWRPIQPTPRKPSRGGRAALPNGEPSPGAEPNGSGACRAGASAANSAALMA